MDTSGFHIFSDSCCDLPKEYCQEHEIGVIPLYVAFSDGEYKRDFYDFTYHEFYQKMKDHPGDFPKTSLPGLRTMPRCFALWRRRPGNPVPVHGLRHERLL